MAPRVRWQDDLGRQTLNDIVKKVIPAWKHGLRPVQADLVAPILDGDDILCCTATGDGKSAAFSVPILVLNEYNANPDLYPAGLRTRANPVGVIFTPTKGLANNIVCRLGPSSSNNINTSTGPRTPCTQPLRLRILPRVARRRSTERNQSHRRHKAL
ncbi:hypothetical protein B0H17DRAFT_939604 [Mycena rosella]|uniref:DEAD/DEAH-box helicase domain-containing protein n=1 Tax=Mycena rosella TaxID=1033263 RepID=A0AAD7GBW5_MYCRO|nr:hypothetical protein B0H17DRAFT_939604 [Mycena rosella]